MAGVLLGWPGAVDTPLTHPDMRTGVRLVVDPPASAAPGLVACDRWWLGLGPLGSAARPRSLSRVCAVHEIRCGPGLARLVWHPRSPHGLVTLGSLNVVCGRCRRGIYPHTTDSRLAMAALLVLALLSLRLLVSDHDLHHPCRGGAAGHRCGSQVVQRLIFHDLPLESSWRRSGAGGPAGSVGVSGCARW